MTVWLLTDAGMDGHATAGHPERVARREAVAGGVRDGADAAGAALVEPAIGPIANAELEAAHTREYLAFLVGVESEGGGWLDGDTYLVPGSLAAARLAAAASVQAVRAVRDGEAEVAFAVGRPPGHHAAAARGGGFCLLNNVAIAAAALRREGTSRIAILDVDVHHGDGTQAIFDADPDLFYASTHQSPLYPGTGSPAERGTGEAEGTKHNRPLAAGAGDAEFVAAWRDELLPAIEAHGPQAILISAGYDAHRDDPLAHLRVTDAGFAAVARLVGELSGRLALPGVALTLEGGYDLDALRASASATVSGLIEGRRPGPEGT